MAARPAPSAPSAATAASRHSGSVWLVAVASREATTSTVACSSSPSAKALISATIQVSVSAVTSPLSSAG